MTIPELERYRNTQLGYVHSTTLTVPQYSTRM